MPWRRFFGRAGLHWLAFAMLIPRPGAAAWPGDPFLNVPLTTAADAQILPVAVEDGASGAIVAWVDYRSGTSIDIYAQRVLADGEVDPAWPADGRALCTAAGNQSRGARVKARSLAGTSEWWARRDPRASPRLKFRRSRRFPRVFPRVFPGFFLDRRRNADDTAHS